MRRSEGSYKDVDTGVIRYFCGIDALKQSIDCLHPPVSRSFILPRALLRGVSWISWASSLVDLKRISIPTCLSSFGLLKYSDISGSENAKTCQIRLNRVLISRRHHHKGTCFVPTLQLYLYV